ncbi:MAG: amidoligase family protein [Elusimicrobia bacterium]|nr:amidoligase family protein [Elusimicrobiota bacterium]
MPGSGIAKIYREGKPTFWESKSFEKNPFKRFTAVEIEVASSNPRYWKEIEEVHANWKAAIKSDGSLPDTGYEINTSPANGDLFRKEIREICSVLKMAKAVADLSCGLHVHVDASDFKKSPAKMINLALLFSNVEKALYDIVDRRRKTNHYCQSVSEYLNTFESTVQRNIKAGYGVDNCLTNKYSTLNMSSLRYHGTFEFRMHHGTVNFKSIYNWALLCTSIVELAATLTPPQIVELVSGKENLEILKAISATPGNKNWIMKRYKYFNELRSAAREKNKAAREIRRAEREARRQARVTANANS